MGTTKSWTCFLFLIFIGCGPAEIIPSLTDHPDNKKPKASLLDQMQKEKRYGKGALLLTKFQSFKELQKVIQIEYFDNVGRPNPFFKNSPMVRVTHLSGDQNVTSILKSGVSQSDFTNARDGGLGAKIKLVLKSPFSVWIRKDLQRIYILSRWRPIYFKEGDVAFYDLAKAMMLHISDYDRKKMSPEDLGEKGYINTFNHMTNQAIITSIFSERLAELIADAHERFSMPELITGEFTEEQIADLETGPTDNYVDIINNAWGQELGKQLKEKYKIDRNTVWTPKLLASYLNDIQQYGSRAFQIGFDPFCETEEVVIRFSDKLNRVIRDKSLVKGL
jgi:hypothetical protein